MTTLVTRDRIAEVERLIRPYIRRTPLVTVDAADFGLPRSPLHFKLELMRNATLHPAERFFTECAGAKQKKIVDETSRQFQAEELRAIGHGQG